MADELPSVSDSATEAAGGAPGATEEWQPVGIDISAPHAARVWNYWLGGKDNFAVDRALGEQILTMMPEMVESARADRGFLLRVVRHLVAEAGIRQFLDIGTGLPSANNTHEVAQGIDPSCRIVYVDNDPIVLAHARALLTSTPEGATHYIDADARDTGAILAEAGTILDFTRPVGVMLLGILNFIGDDDEARAIVEQLVAAVPSGSYVALAHPTAEVRGEAMTEAVRQANETSATPLVLRNPKQIEALLAGLELLPPGIVSCPRWRPDPDGADAPDVPQFCALAYKP